MVAAFIGIFGMFIGLIMMMNASPPDTSDSGWWLFLCGVVLTGATFIDVILKAVT